jgi:hypothetical protein
MIQSKTGRKMINVGKHIRNLKKSKGMNDGPSASFHKLSRVGEKAVGPLIKAISNTNTTRAAFSTDTGRYTLRVCDLALQIIVKYFEKFRETSAPEFRFEPNAEDKTRQPIASKWMDWWKSNQKLIRWNRQTYHFEYLPE